MHHRIFSFAEIPTDFKEMARRENLWAISDFGNNITYLNRLWSPSWRKGSLEVHIPYEYHVMVIYNGDNTVGVAVYEMYDTGMIDFYTKESMHIKGVINIYIKPLYRQKGIGIKFTELFLESIGIDRNDITLCSGKGTLILNKLGRKNAVVFNYSPSNSFPDDMCVVPNSIMIG